MFYLSFNYLMVDHNDFFKTKLFFLVLVTLKFSQVSCWLLVDLFGGVLHTTWKVHGERSFNIDFLGKQTKDGKRIKEKYLCVYLIA